MSRQLIPGTNAGGHEYRGFWHPGAAAGCPKCPEPTHFGSVIVYVPTRDSLAQQAFTPGCAIVGRPEGRGILVDLEDNRYGSVEMKTFAGKVRYAAGRHVTKYPTVARRFLPNSALLEVGTYDYDNDRLDITNPTQLNAWSNQ